MSGPASEPAEESDVRLNGKVAIVTGGGHGIGAAYCEGLAREGATVAVAELDAKAAHAVAEKLGKDGHRALAVPTDVAQEASTKAMAAEVVKAFGRIDVLINNAAIFATIPMTRGLIDEISPEEWDRMMLVNLKGTFLSCRAVLPAMRQQRSGPIINISSGTVFAGPPTRIHYITSKAGILGFTRCLAREEGPNGIRVNTIAPGSTLSEADPTPEIIAMRQERIGARALPRVQYPSDLVGAAVFLASDESGFMTGQTLVVDGGAVML
jgi:3-oxoacyl-[acyl-carrier protein] reductase